jgi:hypothetical protein
MASGDRERVMRGDQVLAEREVAGSAAPTHAPAAPPAALAHIPVLPPPPEGTRRPPSSWLRRR